MNEQKRTWANKLLALACKLGDPGPLFTTLRGDELWSDPHDCVLDGVRIAWGDSHVYRMWLNKPNWGLPGCHGDGYSDPQISAIPKQQPHQTLSYVSENIIENQIDENNLPEVIRRIEEDA